MKQTNLFAITISRQLGSGGSSIGQQLAKKMNFFFADREIISKAAKELSVLENDLESREEKILSFWESLFKAYTIATDVYVATHLTSPTDREVYETQAEVIKHIAEEHSAIIIGRCGFHILREHPNHISIFLYADKDFRNNRVQNMYHVSKDIARKMIDQSDKERAFYCKTFTGLEWADAINYDLSINTGKVDIDKAAELILNYLKLVPGFDEI